MLAEVDLFIKNQDYQKHIIDTSAIYSIEIVFILLV